MSTGRWLAFAACIPLTFPPAFHAAHAKQVRHDRIAEDLALHESATREFMARLPRKWDSQGREYPSSWSLFPAAETASGRYIQRKSLEGPQPVAASGTDPELSPILSGDDPATIADPMKYVSLSHMLDAGLQEARLPEQPWSGDYWPINHGIIGQRYTDPGYPASSDWKENSDYSLGTLGAVAGSSSVDDLSPAEKYDLLVGDTGFTLTRRMWAEGKKYYDQTGSVDSWMGICHGWAPASYLHLRPLRKIEAMAADGKTRIPFYPDDLKALASALWANVSYKERFTGHRCYSMEPATDPNTGRVTDPACLDSNPATWHLAIVNRIGGTREAFVMDASTDYQVWNQPVIGYRYTLFNPRTKEQGLDLKKARVALAEFPEDPYRAFRTPTAKYVVGVAMDVEYLGETSPSHQDSDSPDKDSVSEVEYLYDLELDSAGKLVGGEWYTNAHPDFLWTPTTGAKAVTDEDRKLAQTYPTLSWAGDAPMPQPWMKAARLASRKGAPLAKVLDTLTTLSRVGL